MGFGGFLKSENRFTAIFAVRVAGRQ